MNLISFNEMAIACGIGTTLGVFYGENLFLKQIKSKAIIEKVSLNIYNYLEILSFAEKHEISRLDCVLNSGSVGILSAIAYAQFTKLVKKVDEYVHEIINQPLNLFIRSGFGVISTFIATKAINYSLKRIDPRNQPVDFLAQAFIFWPGFIYYGLLHASDLSGNNSLE